MTTRNIRGVTIFFKFLDGVDTLGGGEALYNQEHDDNADDVGVGAGPGRQLHQYQVDGLGAQKGLKAKPEAGGDGAHDGGDVIARISEDGPQIDWKGQPVRNADVPGQRQGDHGDEVAHHNGKENGLDAQAGEHIRGVGEYGQENGHADPHHHKFQGGDVPVLLFSGEKLCIHQAGFRQAF